MTQEAWCSGHRSDLASGSVTVATVWRPVRRILKTNWSALCHHKTLEEMAQVR